MRILKWENCFVTSVWHYPVFCFFYVTLSFRLCELSFLFCFFVFSVSLSFCLCEFIVSSLLVCFLSFGYHILSVLSFFLFVCPFTINCIFCSLFSFNCVQFLQLWLSISCVYDLTLVVFYLRLLHYPLSDFFSEFFAGNWFFCLVPFWHEVDNLWLIKRLKNVKRTKEDPI